jgi:hypothetical protein
MLFQFLPILQNTQNNDRKLLQHHPERHRQEVLDIVDEYGYNRSICPYESRVYKNIYNLEGYALVCNPFLDISPVSIEL